MSNFQVHTIESAPAAARPTLEGAKRTLGFVPNLYGVMAESPALLKAYKTVGAFFDTLTTFTPTERQIVLLTTSFDNQCHYCVAAHTTLAGMQKVPSDVVQSVRNGEPIAEARLEALRTFTLSVVAGRGWVSEDETQAFLDAGFTKAQLLEVILGVGMKTLSNYVNHVADIPVDDAFQPNAWAAPVISTTAN